MMPLEEVVAITTAAGGNFYGRWDMHQFDTNDMRKLIEQVRAAEREAIAKEFDRRAVYADGSPSTGWYEPNEPAEIIRGRGKQ